MSKQRTYQQIDEQINTEHNEIYLNTLGHQQTIIFGHVTMQVDMIQSGVLITRYSMIFHTAVSGALEHRKPYNTFHWVIT